MDELYGVQELETGDGRVDPQAIYRRREARLLGGMLKGGSATLAIYRRREARLLGGMLRGGSATLLYTGVAVNLLAVRHEVCTVLVIDDPRWYARESGELRSCYEYVHQSQQAELLPDQRWVQLISLDRRDLELAPQWRQALNARNVVAPGAAAVELGLRVARAVTA